MRAKITILNHKEALAAQANDIRVYNFMALNISGKLNQIGFQTLAKILDEGTPAERHAIFEKNKEQDLPLVIIQPFHLGRNETLTRIHVDVSDERAYTDCVRPIVENYADKYNNLEEITIRTYF